MEPSARLPSPAPGQGVSVRRSAVRIVDEARNSVNGVYWGERVLLMLANYALVSAVFRSRKAVALHVAVQVSWLAYGLVPARHGE